MARQLIEQAQRAGVLFRAVVSDSVSGENGELVEWLHTQHISYVLALKPSHAVWQYVPDPDNPPPFSPIEAAARLPREAWQSFERLYADGTSAQWYAVDLTWGGYGVDRFARLVVATTDPASLPPKETWCLQTNLPLTEAPPGQVAKLYGLRGWVEVFYKQAKDELGWADWEVRSGEAIQRHWHLVFCAYTFTLLYGLSAFGGEKKRPKNKRSRVGWGASGRSDRGYALGSIYVAGGAPGVLSHLHPP